MCLTRMYRKCALLLTHRHCLEVVVDTKNVFSENVQKMCLSKLLLTHRHFLVVVVVDTKHVFIKEVQKTCLNLLLAH